MSVMDPSDTLTGGSLLAQLLSDYGVEYVFGVPSEAPQLVSHLFDAGTPRYVVVRDERAAPFAANVYAKLTGRVAVLDAAPSVGTSMMVAGLAEALNASIPMVGIFTETTQKAGSMRRLGAINQATEQEAFLRPVVKYCARVDSVQALPSLVRMSFQLATTGRPGPVVLLVPYDVLEADAGELDWIAPDPKLAALGALRSMPARASLREAAVALSSSSRPIIVAGGGVMLADAGRAVVALAEEQQMPVTTTLSGAGSIDEGHELALGTAGVYGLPAASQAIEHADTLLLVGMKSNGYATWFWRHPRPGQRVIHLDVDPAEPGKAWPDVIALVGDAKEGLTELRAVLSSRERPDRTEWRAFTSDLRRETWQKIDSEQRIASAQTGKATSAVQLAAELDRRLAPGDVVICEASQTTGWASRMRLPADARRITFRGLGVLGGGIGGAVGARLAVAPDQRVILFTGDGAMGYQIGELATLARLDLNVIVIVLNNGCLGAVHIWPGMPPGSAEIGEVDFAAAARATGCAALRVEQPAELAAALDEAFACPGPVVVDVLSDRNEWAPLSFAADGAPIAPFDWD